MPSGIRCRGRNVIRRLAGDQRQCVVDNCVIQVGHQVGHQHRNDHAHQQRNGVFLKRVYKLVARSVV